MIFKPENNLIRFLTRTFLLTALMVAISTASGPIVALGCQEAPPQETENGKSKKEADDSEGNQADKQAEKESDQGDPADSDKTKTDQESGSGDEADAKQKTESGESESGEAGSGTTESGQPSTRRRRRTRSMEQSRRSRSFLSIFQPAITQTALATVEIKKGSRTISLGSIVDADGFVLTKQSELRGPLTCKLSDGREVAAYVYGVHRGTDLALLKIEAVELPVIQWAETDTLGIGHWLATVKDKERPLAVGVVSVNARLIKPQSGFMGVNLQQAEKGVMVTNVTADSPAKRGGLLTGDVIYKVNGEVFTEIEKLITRVKSFPPGESIRLTLLREERELVLTIVLGEERSLNPAFERSNQQNTMGGNSLSRRRQDFPMAIQHDAVLKPEECGGPVVNIDGEVVGINIARQGRVSSLMLPASLVMPIVHELKSGQLAPAVVHKSRIDEIRRLLSSLTNDVNLSPMNDDNLDKKVKRLNQEEKELRSKLEKITKERIRAEVRLEEASTKFDANQHEIERLEQERERLVTGSK